MSQTHAFATVRRGYDPGAVEQAMAELALELQSAEQRSAELRARVDALTAAAAAAGAPTFADLGERVGTILTLAEQEASEIRTNAEHEAERRLSALAEANAGIRADAKRYADETLRNADREATRIVEDAKRSAEQLLDEAGRQASTRRAETEALAEQQRAQSAKAAADFEQALAARRATIDQEFEERARLTERQLVAAQEYAVQVRADAELLTEQASARAAHLVAEAERTAERIVAEAMERADRIRAESEREIAAAADRRDAINRQLVNVRRMLASVSAAAPGLVELDTVLEADPAVDEPASGAGPTPDGPVEPEQAIVPGQAEPASEPAVAVETSTAPTGTPAKKAKKAADR